MSSRAVRTVPARVVCGGERLENFDFEGQSDAIVGHASRRMPEEWLALTASRMP
jgi:hypothetical protein